MSWHCEAEGSIAREMKSIPAFSKKTTGGGVATGSKARSGFLDHVKTTNAGKGKAVPHMAANYPTKSTLSRTAAKGNPAHPAFKSGSGKAGKSVAAFSKKKI
jgi:hypothetical protein